MWDATPVGAYRWDPAQQRQSVAATSRCGPATAGRPAVFASGKRQSVHPDASAADLDGIGRTGSVEARYGGQRLAALGDDDARLGSQALR